MVGRAELWLSSTLPSLASLGMLDAESPDLRTLGSYYLL
jgi:hypothetical protein